MQGTFLEDLRVLYDVRRSFGTAMGGLRDLPTLAALKP